MSATKKRKREDDEADKITLKVDSTQNTGPVLASFPSFTPAASTSFKCYSTAEGKMIVAGEADTVEFSTSSETEQVAASGCKYLIGLYDARTKTCTLRSAPVHIFTHTVKPLKSIQPNEVSVLPRMEARAKLGGAFGTKKAMAAIRTAERNKVDVGAMEGVMSFLQERIEDGTGGLPTLEEARETADANRLIPKYVASAEDPEDVYPLHNIIPEEEWGIISTADLLNAEKKDHGPSWFLPFARSIWVNQHLKKEMDEKPVNRGNIKILYYISAMMVFRVATLYKPIDVETLNKKLDVLPTLISQSLLARFVETARDSKTIQTTSGTETSLLTHMLALCLRVDRFATDPIVLSSDLGLPLARLTQLFKSLGCKMELLKERELGRLGLPESAGDTKRAVLRAPVEFPKPKMRRKAK